MTTVLIINAPKIFVKSAEDFLKDTAKKKFMCWGQYNGKRRS